MNGWGCVWPGGVCGRGWGLHDWGEGGMNGWKACMAGGCAWLGSVCGLGGGHAWMRGICGWWHAWFGACIAWEACMASGHVWLVAGGMHGWGKMSIPLWREECKANFSWRIYSGVVPGFPVGGVATLRVRQHKILPMFPKKLHEIGKNLGQGGVRRVRHLDPPLLFVKN